MGTSSKGTSTNRAGIGHNAIAVDENYLYCAQDGFGWGGTKGVDFSSEDWKATWTLTVARYDLKTGKVVEFPGKKRAFEADTMEVGPGSNHPDLRSFNLGGLAVLDGKIYLGSRDKNAVIIFDAETGKKTGSHAVKGVRHLAAGKSNLYAATDSGIVRVDGGKTIISSSDLDITGLTIGPKGDFWLTGIAPIPIADGASKPSEIPVALQRRLRPQPHGRTGRSRLRSGRSSG